MGFRYSNSHASQALDINQRIGQLAGYGLVDGGEYMIGARPYAVDFERLTAYLQGEEVDLDATSVDLSEYSPSDNPRKVVVYVDLDEDDNGVVRVAAGDTHKPEPEGNIRRDTYRPSPPDLSGQDVAPLAEVWLGAGSQQVVDEDVFDRRLTTAINAHRVEMVRATVDTLIDGDGVRHEEGLGTAGTSWDDIDVTETINSDPNHGEDAYHAYFSGDHADLTDAGGVSDLYELIVGAGETHTISESATESYARTRIEPEGRLVQESGSVLSTRGNHVNPDRHHPRITEEDIRDVMPGLDAADLSADSAETPGMHLAIPDGENAQWVGPPMAEAPVVDSGTLTHSGGSETAVTLDNVTEAPVNTSGTEIHVWLDEPPSWNADFDYSTETTYRWDESSDHADVDLTLTWSIDPGSGNDLALRYAAVDMSAGEVTSLYGPANVRRAVDGASVSVDRLDVTERLRGDTRSELPDTSTVELGDTAVIDGDGSAAFGEYVYDGVEWAGPYAAGLTSLSDLLIDAETNWNGNRIRDLGAPSASDAVIRPADISAHSDNSAAHHDPLSGDQIDHTDLQNVQPGQHHGPPSRSDLGSALSRHNYDVPLTTSEIPDGSASRVHVHVDANERFDLVRGEFYNDNGGTPSGLRLQVVDRDSDTIEYGQWLWHETAPIDDSLLRLDGPRDLLIRLNNATGSTQVAGGVASYVLTRG